MRIGDRCKVEASASPPPGVVLEDDASPGPYACPTNDRRPRARGEWEKVTTVVRRGASIGAGAAGLPGVEIGEGAMGGAGAVVTRDVPDRRTVVVRPAGVVRTRPAPGRSQSR